MTALKQSNRILIVEDDASIRGLMTRHFKRRGYEVEQAGAAEEVIARLDGGKRFDVVVTDVHLPGESGVDLARRLHALSPEQPIVFMTGDSDAGIARQALQDGAAGYLLKPFEFFELDAVVNHAVQRKERVGTQLRSVRRGESAHVTLPAKVVLAPARPRPSTFAARARVALATAAMLGLAWLAGVGMAPGGATSAPVQPAAAVAQATSSQPMVIPVMIDRTVYMK
jgi:DNA-binding response OmpR family regulator